MEKLKLVYSHYEESDIWQALRETMNLYRELAVDTASKLGIEYPHLADQMAAQLVRKFDNEYQAD